MNRFLILVVICGLLLCPSLSAKGDAYEQGDERGFTEQYNHLLTKYFPDGKSLDAPLKAWQIENLIILLNRLLAAPITDPSTLQHLSFAASYEILFVLETNLTAEQLVLITRWKKTLIELDIKAHNINNFPARPTARWLIEQSKSIRAAPTARMLEGYIEREQNTAYISKNGLECGESKRGCEKLRYVLIKCLVPGVRDSKTARTLIDAFDIVKANPHVTSYWKILLDPERKLMRRDYRIRPLPGCESSIETYGQSVYENEERIVVLEQNTRVGKFTLRSDTMGVYIQSPPHGVTVVMILSGKYVMEELFYLLFGDKLVSEPVEVMAILRQYILDPEKGADSALEAGRRDYLENQVTE